MSYATGASSFQSQAALSTCETKEDGIHAWFLKLAGYSGGGVGWGLKGNTDS